MSDEPVENGKQAKSKKISRKKNQKSKRDSTSSDSDSDKDVEKGKQQPYTYATPPQPNEIQSQNASNAALATPRGGRRGPQDNLSPEERARRKKRMNWMLCCGVYCCVFIAFILGTVLLILLTLKECPKEHRGERQCIGTKTECKDVVTYEPCGYGHRSCRRTERKCDEVPHCFTHCNVEPKCIICS